MGCYTNAGPIPYIEAKWLVRSMPIEPDPAVGLRQDIHIDDGGHRSEVLWHPNADVWTLSV